MTDHLDQEPLDGRSSDVTRRMMLRGAAVSGLALPVLAACGGSDSEGSGSSNDPKTPASGASDSPSSDSSGGGTTVPTADVPVGGGTILKDAKAVVTQPTKGDFKAFTSICTHQGCPVTSIVKGEIVCPCHQSHYSIEDGSVISGPAPSPLAAKTVSVKGDQISVT